MITYVKNEPVGRAAYYACFSNSIMIGTLDQEVDGFYYFFPHMNGNGGFWAGFMLLDIGRKLDALNEAWSRRINEEVDKLKFEDHHHSPCSDWTPKTAPKK